MAHVLGGTLGGVAFGAFVTAAVILIFSKCRQTPQGIRLLAR